MMKEEKHGRYVQQVRENTQRYVQDLLHENERLRACQASLETENMSLQKEQLRLQQQLLASREELDRRQQEHQYLQRQLGDIEGANRAFAEESVRVEQQNTDLANLYVASYSLHGTLDRSQVLQAIQEIIINLIGSEELAVFEMAGQGETLHLAASFGLDEAAFQRVPLGTGIIGGVVRNGEKFLAGTSPGNRLPEEANLTVCIPLRVEERVTGAIAVFRLLPQKAGGLGTLDHELLDLLGTQAASALYCTSLHRQAVSASTERAVGA